MTTTMGALLQAEGVLERLGTERVPARVAYHLAKLTDAVRAETKHFHERRRALITELGQERPPTPAEAEASGGAPVIEVTAENREAFASRVNEIAEVAVSIDKWLLTIDLLDAFTLSSDDVRALGPLVTGEEAQSAAPAAARSRAE